MKCEKLIVEFGLIVVCCGLVVVFEYKFVFCELSEKWNCSWLLLLMWNVGMLMLFVMCFFGIDSSGSCMWLCVFLVWVGLSW